MGDRRHTGYTVLELVIVVTIASVLMAMAIPPVTLALDRISVEAAAGDIGSLLATARSLAIAGHSSVAVDVDSTAGVIRVRRGTELLVARNIGEAHGVRLSKTRDSLSYDWRGLGRGAANLSIVVRRRAAAETVFVSRLGRVR